MTHNPNHMQPGFTDFLDSLTQDGYCQSTLGFNVSSVHETPPQPPPRYQPPEIQQNVISNQIRMHQPEMKRLIGGDIPRDEDVFAQQAPYFDQLERPSPLANNHHPYAVGSTAQKTMNQQPFVTYADCQNQHQDPHVAVAYNTGQMAGQNYDAYAHTSSPNTGDRASISNSPYTPPVRQEFPVSPTSSVTQSQQKTASIPSLSDYPGQCNFEIYFGASTEHAVKSAQFTHSPMLGKLFVKMNTLCPIQFRCQKQPPEGSVIRALPVYTRPDNVTEIVTRCPNHQISDNSTDHLSRHLIRAEQPGHNLVHYGTSSDGRESVTVNYSHPEVGSQYITVFYKYMCLSSCVGGINRRPIMTIFTLESPDGTVLGRRCVEVRICSCPGRDRSQEERRKRKPCVPAGYVFLPKKKKSASAPSTSTSEPDLCSGDGQEFFLRIKGKEKYEILKKLKEALDLQELISPQQKEEYEQKEASEEASSMKLILSNYFKQLRENEDGDDPFPT